MKRYNKFYCLIYFNFLGIFDKYFFVVSLEVGDDFAEASV